MADPTDARPGWFRAVLDDGQVVETDAGSIPASGGDPARTVLLRMSGTRAHTLAHLVEDWCRVARVFATLRSSEASELPLARALEAGAAAAGDPEAGRCGRPRPGVPSVGQRVTAAAVLRDRERRITPVQRIAVVDAAARWLAEDAGEELAGALLQAVCSDTITANMVYLALIDQPGAVL